MIGAVLGVLLAGRCVVTISPLQGDDGLARDVRTLRLPVVVATDADWRRAGLADAASGSLGLRVDARPAAFSLVAGPATAADGEVRAPLPGVAVEMLTSGTTGPPKRVPLTYAAFTRSISAAGAHYRWER